MGVGSAYLNLQSYGMTLVGVLVAAGGGLGLYISKTTNGKLISGGVVLGGIGMMFLASKIRSEVNTAQTEGSGGFEGVGKLFLGLAVLSAITKAVTAATSKPTLPNDEPQEESQEIDETNSTNGNGE